MIDGAVLAGDAPAGRILAPLRQLAPEIDTFARVPAVSLTRLNMDPESPVPSIGWGAASPPSISASRTRLAAKDHDGVPVPVRAGGD